MVSFVDNSISVLEVQARFPIQTFVIVDKRVGLLCLKALDSELGLPVICPPLRYKKIE